MAVTKAELERRYNVPVYAQWRTVPAHLHSRSWFKSLSVEIPKSAKPDAVKGGGGYGPTIYFLFDERKWLDAESLRKLNIERRPVI